MASQLTRLRLGGIEDLSTLEPCLPGLRHNLQRLELPWMELTDDVYKSLHDLLPGLRCVEFGEVFLSSSHADVDCSWQELRLESDTMHHLQQLAQLPLARAGKRGLQRLVLEGCRMDADVTAVCSSTCQLAPVQTVANQLGSFSLELGWEHLSHLLPLLRCCAPNSIGSFHVTMSHGPCAYGISHAALSALGAAFATGGGAAALARCHTLTLDNCFHAAAVCAALLPMLMTTPIATVWLTTDSITPKQLTALCCPDSLAAVTRPITLRVSVRYSNQNVSLRKAQAAIVAAGKADLVRLMRNSD